MKRSALALGLALSLTAATLPQRIDQIIATSPAALTAFWGIEIVDLTTGRMLYERNAAHFFVPASNAKLFTTALALTRLGPDFTFQTRVMADQSADAEGRIAGSVRLVGGGDPNLSARAIPYKPGPVTGDPLTALQELADQVGILNRGKLIAVGTIDELREVSGEKGELEDAFLALTRGEETAVELP